MIRRASGQRRIRTEESGNALQITLSACWLRQRVTGTTNSHCDRRGSVWLQCSTNRLRQRCVGSKVRSDSGPAVRHRPEPRSSTRPSGWCTKRCSAHAFDRTGRHFVLLDDTGVTHWLDAQAQWRVAKTLPVVAQMPTAAPFPTLLSSRARDTLFVTDVTDVTDVAAKQIAVIDSQNIAVTQRIGLDFSPNGQAWLGIAAP